MLNAPKRILRKGTRRVRHEKAEAVITNENRCLYCSSIIPEGRSICPVCEMKQTP